MGTSYTGYDSKQQSLIGQQFKNDDEKFTGYSYQQEQTLIIKIITVINTFSM